MTMTLIPDDAHVMLAAAVSTKNVVLIADTIMCITDLVTEIQSRFTVAVRPGLGKPMTFGPARLETLTSYPCSTCDTKCKSLKELNAHAKIHTVDEDVRSATQRLHSLSSGAAAGGDPSSWTSQPSTDKDAVKADAKPSPTSGKPSDAHTAGQIASPAAEESSSLKCPICNRVFNKIFLLNIHLSKHQQANGGERGVPNRTYSCRLCFKEFNHMSNRAKHERTCKMSGSDNNSSPISASSSQSPSLVYSCRKCRKPYADNTNRLRHERLCQTTNRNRCLAYTTLAPSKPQGGGANSLELPISVNNYKQMASSAAYMKVLDENGKQTNMFSCIICAKLLQTRNSLESHYMSHLGIKPHACQFCSKRFTDSSNWRKHQRGCTERPSVDSGAISSAPSMVPPLSSGSSHAGYEYPMDTSSVSADYHPQTTSMSIANTETDGQPGETAIKMEAVDITSDNESSAAQLTFNDDAGETRTIIAEVVPEAAEVQPLSVGSAEVEESEEQRDINTANSVVVDSALSWFVSTNEAEKQAEDDNDTS
ncbi:zinc finger protein 181-like [Watersipora subatra]|uniref:zinc finger protein 181-like n=1 Tax=Watersipora subatra TaxID=2589382 RepID=UPI00355B4A10